MTINMLAQANIQHLPLADNSIDLIFTDPPYPREYLSCYDWLAHEAARVLKPGGFVLAMCGGSFINHIFRMMDDAGLTYYWKYENGMTGYRSGQVWINQMPIAVRLKSIIAYSKGASRSRTATVDLFNGNGIDKQWHAWGQDVESARYYIDCFSRPDQIVLDPFIGGGTTLVACGLIGRKCIAFDLEMTAITTSTNRLASAGIFEQIEWTIS